MTQKLSQEDYFKVLTLAPLPSIDLLVQRRDGKFLLGLRVNRPAKGWLFTFGGVILKGEKMGDAYARITETELGVRLDIAEAESIGTWDHIYHDNFLEVEGISTHYVVSAYLLRILQDDITTDSQHSEHVWLDSREILEHNQVHDKVKDYFRHLLRDFPDSGIPFVYPSSLPPPSC